MDGRTDNRNDKTNTTGGNMKKPDQKHGMIYICRECQKEMPVDEVKSKPGEIHLKNKCSCGGIGVMKFNG